MWDRDSVENMLKQDNRTKRQANGAKYNSGRRGGGKKGVTGAMRMPSDVLKYINIQEYRKYTRGGEIVETNFYEDINNLPSLDDIKAKDFKSAQNIIKIAKKSHKMKSLITYWGTSSGSLYKLFDEYEIEYPKRSLKDGKVTPQSKPLSKTPKLDDRKEKGQKQQDKILKAQETLLEESRLIQEKLLQEQENSRIIAEKTAMTMIQTPVQVKEDEDVFHLKYSPKKASGSEIQNNIVNFVSILDKDKEYSVKLIISEVSQEGNKV